jgi:hypothetical protein
MRTAVVRVSMTVGNFSSDGMAIASILRRQSLDDF